MSMNFGAKRMTAGGEDYRYRITVTLIAERRPKYWDFYCVKCKSLVCELAGTTVGIADAADVNAIPDYQPAPQIRKCNGAYCKIYYDFVTLSGKE